MTTKFILSVLRIATSFLFYLLIIGIFFILAKDAFLYSKDSNYIRIDQSPYFKDLKGSKSIELYSGDKKIQYQNVTNLFTVEADVHSALGYYYMLSTLMFLGLGLLLLWNFKKLFEGINMQHPFKSNLVKRLKYLGLIFIISDALEFIHYSILNAFIQQSLENPKLQLLTEIGNHIIIGLIILVIAVIYQRGVEMEEENTLTV